MGFRAPSATVLRHDVQSDLSLDEMKSWRVTGVHSLGLEFFYPSVHREDRGPLLQL